MNYDKYKKINYIFFVCVLERRTLTAAARGGGKTK